MKDHKLVPLRPPESILAVVRKAYGNATAYDVGHVWHEIYTRLPDAAPVQEPACKWPTCQTEQYQQDLSNQVAKELFGVVNEFNPDWDQVKPFLDRIAELEAAQPRKAVKLSDGEVVAVTDEENERFSQDVSNFKGADPEATMYALEQFLKRRAALTALNPKKPTIVGPKPMSTQVSRLLASADKMGDHTLHWTEYVQAREDFIAALDAALKDRRNATLEEAAVKCDALADFYEKQHISVERVMGIDLAADEVRSMKHEQPN